eukprot:gene13628-biopygen3975
MESGNDSKKPANRWSLGNIHAHVPRAAQGSSRCAWSRAHAFSAAQRRPQLGSPKGRLNRIEHYVCAAMRGRAQRDALRAATRRARRYGHTHGAREGAPARVGSDIFAPGAASGGGDPRQQRRRPAAAAAARGNGCGD